MDTIKGRTLAEWKRWIKTELQPIRGEIGLKISDQTKYTLEAFLELIEKFEKGKRKGYY